MTPITGQTPSQTIGPMYGFALAEPGMARTIAEGDPSAVVIEGCLKDGDGEPIAYPDAVIEVWQGDQLARARTDAFGVWRVYVAKPSKVELLPDKREQAPHMNVTVWARGLMKQAQTRLYFPDESGANEKDPVLALVDAERRGLLIARPQPDGALRFDIHLQGEKETVFFDF